ncbi:MAG: ATP-binding cassette domain-containing protein [Pseudobdellovibrionaceae bacterium]
MLCDHDHGRLLFDQRNITEAAYDDLTQTRLKLGYAFDYGGLLSNRSLFDNLLFPLEYHDLLDAETRTTKVKSLFKRFSLEGLENKKPLEVTGKIRKLLCVLRALVYDPQVVILDDPALGLSPEMKEDLVLYIKELMENKTLKQMIFFSQDHFWLQQFQYDELILDEHGVYYQDLHKEKRSA